MKGQQGRRSSENCCMGNLHSSEKPALLPSAPLRVLVVDDYPDAAENTAQLLRAWGFAARTSQGANHALEVFNTYRPHVVLVDLAMPAMDGFRLAHLVRRHPGGHQAVLVAVTGFVEEEYRRRCRAAGFEQFLVKPVDPGQLRNLLEELSRRESRAASAVVPHLLKIDLVGDIYVFSCACGRWRRERSVRDDELPLVVVLELGAEHEKHVADHPAQTDRQAVPEA